MIVFEGDSHESWLSLNEIIGSDKAESGLIVGRNGRSKATQRGIVKWPICFEGIKKSALDAFLKF